MNTFSRVISMIRVGVKHKKNYIKANINKSELNFLKILIKLNKILFFKKINYRYFLIFINSESHLNLIKFSKKNMTLKKKKNLPKDILIISNGDGLNLSTYKKFVHGLVVAKVYF